MNTDKKMLELVKEAYAKAGDAQKCWNEYLALMRSERPNEITADQTATAANALHAFMRIATNAVLPIDAREEARRRRFDGVPVLEAEIRVDSTGEAHRVCVCRPDECGIDEPHLSVVFYNNMLAKWPGAKDGLTSCEDYDIVIADRHNREVAVIKSNRPKR